MASFNLRLRKFWKISSKSTFLKGYDFLVQNILTQAAKIFFWLNFVELCGNKSKS